MENVPDSVQIRRSVRHKKCADGALVKVYELTGPLPPPLLAFFRGFGEVKTFSLAGEEWFSFTWPRMIEVRGKVGDPVVEVRYAAGMHDLVADTFHLLLYYYREGRDFQKVRAIEETIREKIRTRGG